MIVCNYVYWRLRPQCMPPFCMQQSIPSRGAKMWLHGPRDTLLLYLSVLQGCILPTSVQSIAKRHCMRGQGGCLNSMSEFKSKEADLDLCPEPRQSGWSAFAQWVSWKACWLVQADCWTKQGRSGSSSHCHNCSTTSDFNFTEIPEIFSLCSSTLAGGLLE